MISARKQAVYCVTSIYCASALAIQICYKQTIIGMIPKRMHRSVLSFYYIGIVFWLFLGLAVGSLVGVRPSVNACLLVLCIKCVISLVDFIHFGWIAGLRCVGGRLRNIYIGYFNWCWWRMSASALGIGRS